MNVNIGGTWKDSSDQWVKIDGVWKKASSIFTNINGVWKSASGLIWQDDCSTVTGWTTVTGAINSNGTYFYPGSFTTRQANNEYGDTGIQKDVYFPGDFKLDVECYLGNTANTSLMGWFDVYLIDSNGVEFAAIGLCDAWQASTSSEFYANLYNGTTTSVYDSGSCLDYNGFNGTVSISRKGTTWSAYCNGTLKGSITNANFTNQISRIKVVFTKDLKYGSLADLRVNNLKLTSI